MPASDPTNPHPKPGVVSALPAILLAAFLFLLPMLIRGYMPTTHDFTFHVGNWMEVARQWHEGILLPRWSQSANYGFGEPRFIFYPPLSGIAGGLLYVVLPARMAPWAFAFLCLVMAGVCMFLLAREWLPQPYATVAALAYLANPYAVMLIYKRLAASEMLASALFPLLFLFQLRVVQNDRRAILPLSVSYAAIWLTNAPSAVIVSYSMLVVLAASMADKRQLPPWIDTALASALGMALAAFYIVPAAWEQRWVSISLALTLPQNRPESNFLRLVAERMPGRISSVITVGVLNLVLAAIIGASAVRKRAGLPRPWWWILGCLSLFAALFTIPLSLPLWKLLPKMIFVQLPWRWLSVMNVGCAFLFAALLPLLRRNWRKAAIASGVVVIALLIGLYGTGGKPGLVADLQARIARDGGVYAEPQYLPKGEDHGPANHALTVQNDASPTVVMLAKRNAELVVVETDTAQTGGSLELATAWYPAWTAKVNGKPTPVRQQNGNVLIEVPAGQSEVELRFSRTADRTLGGVISLVACVIVLLMLARIR